jgi:hypothetical protein
MSDVNAFHGCISRMSARVSSKIENLANNPHKTFTQYGPRCRRSPVPWDIIDEQSTTVRDFVTGFQDIFQRYRPELAGEAAHPASRRAGTDWWASGGP